MISLWIYRSSRPLRATKALPHPARQRVAVGVGCDNAWPNRAGRDWLLGKLSPETMVFTKKYRVFHGFSGANCPIIQFYE